MHTPLKLIHTRIVRDITFSREARCNDEISGSGVAAVRRLNDPTTHNSVELGGCNYAAKSTVFTEIADLVNMIEIGLQLVVVGIISGPRPRSVDLRYRELINRDFRVDSSTCYGQCLMRVLMDCSDKPGYTFQRHVPPKLVPAS